MPAFITFGRILFAVLFVISGAFKLMDIAGTAAKIEAKVVIPAALTTYTDQIVAYAGMPIWNVLAILVGVLELVGGLTIALNFGARFFSILLILFTIATTFYFHDFWNQTGADAQNNLAHALKNLSLIGGLFIIAGVGRRSRAGDPTYTEV